MKALSKHIEDLILELGGKDALLVYKQLEGKENVSEFLLSDKLKLTINQIRNILYKFDAFNLVKFTRKKDRKKGWYIYFWTFREEQLIELLVKKKQERLKMLEEQMQKEQNIEYYACNNKCMRMPIETAMEYEFTCPECGELTNPDDNSKRVQKLTEEKEEITALLESKEVQKAPIEPPKEKKTTKKTTKKAAKKTTKKTTKKAEEITS